MKALCLLMTALTLHAQIARVNWTKYNYTGDSTAPRAIGWIQLRYDPVSRKTYVHAGYPAQTITVRATNGSPTVTWVSGAQFATPSWGFSTTDAVTVGGQSKVILQGSVTATQLTLTTNYTGTTGDVSMVTQPSTIYAGDHFFITLPGAPTWTYAGGNRSLSAPYTVDGTFPSDRHSYAQTAYDTKRNWLYMTGGANGSGGPPTNTHVEVQVFQADPTQNTWFTVTTVNHPGGSTDGAAMMVYDPVHDVVAYWGGSSASPLSIFCYTQDNPTPGTATAAQIAAGCANADDWTNLAGYTPGTNAPTAAQYAFWGYDSATDAAYFFGGSRISGSVPQNETWKYKFGTKAFTKVGQTNAPPIPVNTGSIPPWPIMAYVSTTHTFVYQYQGASGVASQAYQYDPSADTWTTIPTIGNGPNVTDSFCSSGLPSGCTPGATGTFWYSMDFDPVNNSLVAWSEDKLDLWIGTLTYSSRALMSGVAGAGVLR